MQTTQSASTPYIICLKWFGLVGVAGAAGQLLDAIAVPAGLFLGPMLVAIVFSVCGAELHLHRYIFRFGQGCVGFLVAHSVTWSVLASLAQSWHVMLFATFLTVALSAAVGLGTVWLGGIPGSTAAWGTAPGAAAAMVSMAEESGADSRVVATMQYVRVVCVVMIGSLVSHMLGAANLSEEITQASTISHGIEISNVLISLTVILFGVAAGTKMPAGALLMPLLIGGALQLGGLISIAMPNWLLAFAYGAIGCYIGLRFDRKTVLYVFKHLPTMILGALILIMLCAGCAWFLAYATNTDFLSMYLATSPGGLDAMAIIAVETNADVGLVLAMQTLRLFGVIFTGAYCARQIIRLTQS